ncbi:MAG: chitobiase/beta-hexosaminidase C-terminal domain-containing protein [Leptospiraceae bacterium]|nr:chitobiase/beta-hexosaminidase C-terminal domain-containing protein [Leptospiraceae bacterium]
MLKKSVLLFLILFSLQSCNKTVKKSLIPLLGLFGFANSSASTTEYKIGGIVSGLQGQGLVLQNNGGDDLAVSSDGSFTFSTLQAPASTYNVTIATQPTNPTQTCTISNESGTVVDSDITSIAISCITNEYSIFVNVTGFSTPFILQNNGGNDLNIIGDGGNQFPAKIASGSNYNISLSSQPAGKLCIVSPSTGTIGASDVTISINCADAYTVGGNITNLIGSSLQLQISGSTSQTITIPASQANYTFPTPVLSGSNISVSILSQPTTPWQTCTISNGGPVSVTSNIANIDITCTTDTYTVSGNINGYSGSFLDISDGINTLTISAGDTSFSFPTMNSGSVYNVTVTNQPLNPWQTCTISNGNGTITNANITNVTINCTTNQYSVTGTIVGYTGISGTLLSINDGTSTLSNLPSGSATFTFPPVNSNTAYNVTIVTRPSNPVQTCVVTNPNGTITSANVTNVVINCSNVVLPSPAISGLTGLTNDVTLTENALSAPDNGILQTICFTADGTDPSCSTPTSGTCGAGSIQYTAPFSINVPSTTIKAISCSNTYTNSSIASTTFPMGIVGTPTFSHAPGTYNNDITPFTISSTNATTIYYTTDGTMPTCAGGGTTIAGIGPTTSSITITPFNSNLKAIGCANGYANASASGVYSFTVADPSFTPSPPANLAAGGIVSFSSATAGSYFCYSDSAIPACGGGGTCSVGTVGNYTYPGGTSKTVNAIACKNNYNPSSVASGTYSQLNYTIGGNITGLTTPFGAGTFQLNNGGDTLTIATNGSFTFPTAVANGTSYSVTVSSQPQNPWQTCTVTSGSGTVSGANVNSIAINCIVDQHKAIVNIITPGAYVADGLTITNESGTYGTLNPTGDDPTNQAFNLQDSGSTYAISITQQPAALNGLVCAFEDIPGGTITNADVVINMRCINGYAIGGRVQTVPVFPLNIPLYQGNVTTIVNSSSGLNNPTDLTTDGTNLYVTDRNNNLIRSINLSTNVVTTLATGFSSPVGITTDGISLYVADNGSHTIKKVVISTGTVTTIAGNGTPAFADNTDPLQASFNSPEGITTDGNKLYIADTGNHRIRVMDLATRSVTTLAGSTPGFSDGTTATALFNTPRDIEIVANYIFITDSGNHRLREIDTSTNDVITIAGGTNGASIDGTNGNNFLSAPRGLMTDGGSIYFTESDATGSYRLRRFSFRTGHVTTIVGSNLSGNTDGKGILARFSDPAGITSDGRSMYVAEGVGNSIRKVTDYRLEAYHGYWGPDYSQNQNNLTGINNLTSTTGRFGEGNGAGFYNGTNANATTSDTGLPTGNAPRTLCAWINPTNLPGNNSIATILRYGSLANGNGIGLRNVAGRQKITFTDTGNPTNDVIVNHTLPTGKWSHICGVYDGTRAKLYMNGHLLGIQTGNWNTTLLGTNGLVIGSQAGNISYFHGAIVDTRIYSRVLNEAEINMLAQEVDYTLVDSSFNMDPQNLLLHYTFDNGNAYDLGPLAISGSVSGSPSLVVDTNGFTNAAYNLNGSSQFIQATSSDLLLGNKPRTLCAWIRLASPPTPGNNYSIISYGSGGNATSIGIANNAGTLQVGMSGQSDSLVFNYPVPTTWTHVCGVYAPGIVNGTMDLYINGIQFASQTTSGNWTTAPGNIEIGRHVSGSNYFNGTIDDVRVYDVPLTAWQVRLLSAQVRTGLVARYDFPNDTIDVSGFRNDGTVQNGAATTTDRFGINLTAYLIDKSSVDQKITVADNPVQSPESMSISGWIKPTQDPPSGNSIGILNKAPGYLLTYSNDTINNTLNWTVNGSIVITHTVTLSTSAYSHIAITQIGTSAKLYINGSLVASTNSAPLLPSPNTSQLCIGCGPISNFQNALDDIRIYNRELTPEEIQAIAQ